MYDARSASSKHPMRLLILPLLLIVFSVPFTKAEDLRVITYNIWNGADEEKHKYLASWVKKQDPDVVALQELVGFSKEKLSTFGKSWNHPHALILKEDGYPVGLTAKKPISLVGRYRDGLWHGALHAKIGKIHYMVVHQCPGDYRVRLRESKILTKVIGKLITENQSVIVLGDFNAHTPADRELLDKQSALIERRKESKFMNEGKWDYKTMSHYLDLKLVDLNLKHAPKKNIELGTFPSRALGHASTESDRQRFAERIDFILASPDLAKRSTKSMTHHDEILNKISDHYPISASFKLRE